MSTVPSARWAMPTTDQPSVFPLTDTALPGFSVGPSLLLSPHSLWCGFAESAAIFNCTTICSRQADSGERADNAHYIH